jgi:hypothetical protein
MQFQNLSNDDLLASAVSGGRQARNARCLIENFCPSKV